jgi:hypothetical protein
MTTSPFLAMTGEASVSLNSSLDKCHKTFYVRNLRIFVISYSVFPYWSFQPSIIFLAKARSLP